MGGMEVTEHARLAGELWRTAVHEAGHAVIARRLDLYPGGVTIVGDHDEGTAGWSFMPDAWAVAHAWEQKGKYRDPMVAFRGRIIAYMAGRESEIEILGWATDGDGNDRLQIALMLEQLPGDTDQDPGQVRLEARLRSATRMLVRRHRAAIERVADALLGSLTLQCDQVDALVRPLSTSVPS